MQPHREGAQREAEHDTGSDEFQRIDVLDSGKSGPAHHYCERKYADHERENDVSPCRTTIRHGIWTVVLLIEVACYLLEACGICVEGTFRSGRRICDISYAARCKAGICRIFLLSLSPASRERWDSNPQPLPRQFASM